MAARESGTVAGDQPVSVAGQTGRLAKIVHWTSQAWRLIQTHRRDWEFMRAEFLADLSPGVSRYTPASFNLSPFGHWRGDRDDYQPLAIIDTTGELPLGEVAYETWRARWDRGPLQLARPTEWARGPGDVICFGAIPDAIYGVRGEYQAGPQALASDADIPALPERFHPIIAWRALMLMDEHDEAVTPTQMGRARNQYLTMLSQLERDYLPPLRAQFGQLW